MELGRMFRSASYTWRSLLDGYRMLKKGLTWELGDVGVIRFWLEDGNLVELCSIEVPIEELQQSLEAYLNLHLPWNGIPFVQTLPVAVLNKLQLVTVFGDVRDNPKWAWEGNDIFSSRVAYNNSL